MVVIPTAPRCSSLSLFRLTLLLPALLLVMFLLLWRILLSLRLVPGNALPILSCNTVRA